MLILDPGLIGRRLVSVNLTQLKSAKDGLSCWPGISLMAEPQPQDLEMELVLILD